MLPLGLSKLYKRLDNIENQEDNSNAKTAKCHRTEEGNTRLGVIENGHHIVDCGYNPLGNLREYTEYTVYNIHLFLLSEIVREHFDNMMLAEGEFAQISFFAPEVIGYSISIKRQDFFDLAIVSAEGNTIIAVLLFEYFYIYCQFKISHS